MAYMGIESRMCVCVCVSDSLCLYGNRIKNVCVCVCVCVCVSDSLCCIIETPKNKAKQTKNKQYNLGKGANIDCPDHKFPKPLFPFK